jgi:hypothetical protein
MSRATTSITPISSASRAWGLTARSAHSALRPRASARPRSVYSLIAGPIGPATRSRTASPGTMRPS